MGESNINVAMDLKKEIKVIREKALKKIDFKTVEKEMEIYFDNEKQKLKSSKYCV